MAGWRAKRPLMRGKRAAVGAAKGRGGWAGRGSGGRRGLNPVCAASCDKELSNLTQA